MRLICPACRGFREQEFVYHALGADLGCPGCGRVYPALQVGAVRVPLLLGAAEAGQHAANLVTDLLAHLADPEAWLAGPEEEERQALVATLATYAPAHWGRWATPALASPDLSWVRDWLPASADLPRGPVLVLGCGPGGELPYVAVEGRELIALDANPALVGFAAALAAGQVRHVPWRRLAGRIEARALAIPQADREVLARTAFVCANALDPPFEAGAMAAVVALNLLDSVQDPFVLLGQCEALLADGGVLLLASPYHWQHHITPPELHLDRHLPPGLDQRHGVEALLAPGAGVFERMHLERSADDIAWEVAVHARFSARYALHVMRLRKQ